MATITKLKSGNYRIRKMYNGKNYTMTLDYLPTKKEADRILFDLINKQVGSFSKYTFNAAAKKYIELKKPVLSPSTIRGYTAYLKSYDKSILNTKLNDFDNIKFQEIINSMVKNNLSPKSIRNYVGFIITVVKEYKPQVTIKVKYPQKNKEEPYIPNDEEYSFLLKEAAGTKYEIPLYLAGMGLRLSEICALTLEDITEDGVNITKSKVKNEKNKWVIKPFNKTAESCRFVPLSDNVINLIRERKVIYTGCPNSITYYIHKVTKKLGINDFTLHKLRHYFATKAHAMLIPDASIMKTGGWKTDYVMKSIYRHADKDIVKKDMKKLKDHFSNIAQ